MTATAQRSAGQPAQITDFKVDLPAGGFLHLQTADEVDMWTRAQDRYMEDYVLVKHNDLVTLGALLQQGVIIFRCQTAINGMEPETDANGVPTGNYRRVELDGADLAAYQKTLTEAAKEMRALEKQLGIDKATREAGGAHTVDAYLKTVKRAAHVRGIHISQRTLAYERFVNELRWRLRMLYQGDAEDRHYHGITPKSVLDWERKECERLEQIDTDFAREKGKVFIGQL
jgi:hypothetical protein